ncbi:hypothetical protein B0H19DRAFT_1117198 [Mycena capillaripes]|nr:hypothetical protein B0H19DRAFT_1117198 [Mycena capillaripes]
MLKLVGRTVAGQSRFAANCLPSTFAAKHIWIRQSIEMRLSLDTQSAFGRSCSLNARCRTTYRPSSSLAPKTPNFSPCDAYEAVWGQETVDPESEEIKMHPILQSVDFLISEHGISEAQLYRSDDTDETAPLEDAAVARDLATIPAVHNFSISLEPYLSLPSVRIEVVNSDGITVLDIFTALSRAMAQEVETDEGRMPLAEALGDHRFYEGFSRVKRIGTTLSAELGLGS